MTFRNVSLRSEVYEKLKALKQPGESFSTMLLRELDHQDNDCFKAVRTIQRALRKTADKSKS
jgi:predicted CopG family antitoxin